MQSCRIGVHFRSVAVDKSFAEHCFAEGAPSWQENLRRSDGIHLSVLPRERMS